MLSYGREAAFQKGVVITVSADRDRSFEGEWTEHGGRRR